MIALFFEWQLAIVKMHNNNGKKNNFLISKNFILLGAKNIPQALCLVLADATSRKKNDCLAFFLPKKL